MFKWLGIGFGLLAAFLYGAFEPLFSRFLGRIIKETERALKEPTE